MERLLPEAGVLVKIPADDADMEEESLGAKSELADGGFGLFIYEIIK